MSQISMGTTGTIRHQGETQDRYIQDKDGNRWAINSQHPDLLAQLRTKEARVVVATIEYTLDISIQDLEFMARRAAQNKNRKSVDGPLTVRTTRIKLAYES